jgi:hypothetical protein
VYSRDWSLTAQSRMNGCFLVSKNISHGKSAEEPSHPLP